MRDKILELEAVSRQLEPDASERAAARVPVVEYGEEFLDDIERLNAYNITQDKGLGLLDAPISEHPTPVGEVLELLRRNVDFPGLNPASGGHLGYIPGGGIYFSALGDYLADVFNRYAGVFFASPGAVRMENMLIRWTAEIFGFPADAAGNLTSGGSLANLISIVTARDARGLRSAEIERAVIYLSEQAHHSVDKAIRIAGLRECVIRHLPLDERYRIMPPELARLVAQDKAAGLRPFLVVASAGTTDVGAVDPLDEIGEICQQNGLWYHVDAAYGGFFALTGEGKRKLRGIERADSLVVDPHKGLFLPYGLGIVLVKDRQALNAAHFYQANYMQDAQGDTEEASPAELSPELTKHFRGLRLWLPLKLHGVAPFRACLEEKLLLARYFHEEVARLGFETGPAPELSVVTYRYLPRGAAGDLEKINAFNKKLLEAVVADGRVFISSTMLEGKFTLRFACLAFRTRLKTVDLLLEILRENVARLERKD
jgi:glutamate/tyrosine decarboxylase-like PLP-dependent enzyme